MSDTSPNTNVPTTPTTLTISSNTPGTSGQSSSSNPHSSSNTQGNKQRFKGSKSRYNKKKRSGGAPKQASVPNRAPLNEYLSVCCGLPARKPQTGRKEQVQNAENGKSKEQAKGLGKWRCSGCQKACKVKVMRACVTTGIIKTTEAPTGSYMGIERTSSPEVPNEPLPA